MPTVYEFAETIEDEDYSEPRPICDLCNKEIDDLTIYTYQAGQCICENCQRRAIPCTYCDTRILEEDNFGTSEIPLCENCRNEHYYECSECQALGERCYARERPDGALICPACNEKFEEEAKIIHSYNYRPKEFVFHGTDSQHFYGIEVEMDEGGESIENALALMDIANERSEHIYTVHDGSLRCGLELVSHPCTLKYHKEQLPWQEIFDKAIKLGYKSHMTNTSGLHLHCNLSGLSENQYTQDQIIAKILYFFELHWLSLLKFSRRTPAQLRQWANRYGYSEDTNALLDAAKLSSGLGRYAAVNLQSKQYGTIEFRIFRGTLKKTTLLAAIQLVDQIIYNCKELSEEELKLLSWQDFVLGIDEAEKPELINYLKKRRLFVNEPINDEENEQEGEICAV